MAALAGLRALVTVRPGGPDIQVDDDPSLVAATLDGRNEAFGTLVERYDRAVYNLCLRTLRDVEEAKDATQEAFFKAFRGLRTFRPGAKFSTWIFSIAYHACCDRLARRKRYSDGEMTDRADPGPGPAQLVERLDEASTLRAAIDGLPEKYRAVITMYHLQGHQYEEIARVLDLPMGTVKTHLFRAKELLRRRLSGAHDAASAGEMTD
jgi:RNA polymerase sigma-70 factor (ECF subfamily)